ncbi:hypothetical protein [Actinoplanes sp. NPDC051411]|jgi:hypothetical protein
MRTALNAITYYLIVAPRGLLARRRRDPLRLRRPDAPSYWLDLR